jgi:UPF0755 protein
MLRLISKLLKVGLLLVVLLGALATWYGLRPLTLKHPVVDFEIAKGASMRQISYTVNRAGVEVSPLFLTWLARLSGHAVHVKAGSYRIQGPMTTWDLVNLLSFGANRYSEITLIEGWSFAKLRQTLDEQPEIGHETKTLDDALIMQQLGMPGLSAEGMFAPDTYSFVRGSSDMDILRRAAQRMQKILNEEWNERASHLPLKSSYEALILASVIEKETGQVQDRPLIASVFINRLRLGMPLQSDPTVIYGLGANYAGNLHKRDLQADTPFNSYTRGGLPPTPIAMPGAAALHAALHPAEGKYLYFVAKGDGSSVFSRTLEEHNRAVARYLKVGKQ